MSETKDVKIASSSWEELLESGIALGTKLGGAAFLEIIASLRETDPELAEYLVAYGYGKVMARSGLSLSEKELVIVAALTSLGYTPQLKWHLNAALNIGVELDTLKEVIVQTIQFAGWPVALNGVARLREVAAVRGLKIGGGSNARTPEEYGERADMYKDGFERGALVYANFSALADDMRAFDADLPDYLIESSFGRIYGRPGLDLRQRELIAVSMLAAMQRLPQLAGHINGAHRVGCTPLETKEVLIIMHAYVGWPAALNALDVWKAVTSK